MNHELADVMTEEKYAELKQRCSAIRKQIIDMICQAGSGHPGGSLSIVETVVVLYEDIMKVNPEDPDWPLRDRLILSKGHACAALYTMLAEKGFFPREELATFRKFGSKLQGHPDCKKTPGVETSTGSLGQGISVAVGMAMAAKLAQRDNRVFAIVGDGECNEGQVWEAALSAAHWKLDNLMVIIDRNNVQLDGPTESILSMGSFADKWKAFGFDVRECDGHDVRALHAALKERGDGKPVAVVANTVKGKGISFMEGKHQWHGGCLDEEQYNQAMMDLAL